MLEEELGGVEDFGQEIKTEIQVYTTTEGIDLKDYVGYEISFQGEFFEAQTAYHQRSIVFEIKEIEGH